MSDNFDAQLFNDPVYKQILGIEATDSVGDWYALLGVDKFESDNATILKAVEQRFERVRRYKVGKYEVQSQRLIDELGRARACLTNEQERRKYNETLAEPTGDPVADAIESTLLNAPAFDEAEPQDLKGASVYQKLGAGAIESDADAKQATRRSHRKPDMAKELRRLGAGQPSRTKAAWSELVMVRLTAWRGVDGTSILPTLLLFILLIVGTVVVVRGKHRKDMERAHAVESEVKELRAEAASLQLTIADGERMWREGTERLQAKRPLEAQKALESAASHYAKAIEAEKRRARR